MAGETVITIVGNLVDDPELRFTPAGAAVAKFRVASTPTFFDKDAGEWKQGQGLFLTCSAWRQLAENVAESLQRGQRVIVQGRLKQRTYETNNGEKRTVYELDVDEVGPSLKYATAKIARNQRQDGQQQAQGGRSASGWGHGASSASQAPQGAPAADDPWATQSAAGYSEEPPF